MDEVTTSMAVKNMKRNYISPFSNSKMKGNVEIQFITTILTIKIIIIKYPRR
jgi:hypothetical protein